MFPTRVHRRLATLGPALGAAAKGVAPSPALACGLHGKPYLVLAPHHGELRACPLLGIGFVGCEVQLLVSHRSPASKLLGVKVESFRQGGLQDLGTGETMTNHQMEKQLESSAVSSRESQAVRSAFASQAEYCRRLGSPFTACLCEALAAGLDMCSAAGRAILGWTGDPSPLVDNVPLRAIGALNALARSPAAPYLAALYPPNPLPDAGELARAVLRALDEHPGRLEEFLSSPPQTNEVGRSAVLIGGFLTIAHRTSLPLDLYEIGSSAGLNLHADRFRYHLGSAEWGAPDATLCLAPSWDGPPPPVEAALTIRSRCGCDANPIDLRDAAARERLVAYIWADQAERIARIEAAIDAALPCPVTIDCAEGADWVERRIELAPVAGITRVLFHSVVWSYLSESSRERIRAHVRRAAATATGEAPLAWLRFELADPPELRLTLWPSGDEIALAHAHPHGSWVRWLA